MKIVNREEFLKLPCYTLYAKYTDIGGAQELEVKYDTLWLKNPGSTHDWIQTCVLDQVQIDEATERVDEDESVQFDMRFDITKRDGCFDTQDLYVVFEKKDLEGLIGLLNKCLLSSS